MSSPSIPLNLKKILAAAQLPALPPSAIRLLELAQDPGNGPAEFAPPIESDPGLTGQVLRFVNSSYFGFSREISSIKAAIGLVGIRTIKNFALWSALFTLIPNPKCGPLELKGLWQDSLRRALLARILARQLAVREVEEPFAAALLQDMAIPLLAKATPDVYAKLLQAREQGKVRLSVLEEKVFGWNHAEAGGIMARQWNLPHEFATLIENHLAVESLLSQAQVEPAKLSVALSALLPTIVDPKWHEWELLEQAYHHATGCESPPMVELLARVDREFAGFAPVLKLSSPSKSLVDSFHEVATVAMRD